MQGIEALPQLQCAPQEIRARVFLICDHVQCDAAFPNRSELIQEIVVEIGVGLKPIVYESLDTEMRRDLV